MDFGRFYTFGKKIVCIDQNYRVLAEEQGNPIPESPIVFLKPTSSYVLEGQVIRIPPKCLEFYHEVELGLVVGWTASHVPEARAMDYIAGFVLALDMTAQDFQQAAKASRQPWALAKGFDTACPISKFIPKSDLPNISDASLWLKVAGITKQDSRMSDMIFSVPYLISYLSEYFTLQPGDLILTGSPAGAGPVRSTESIHAGLNIGRFRIMEMEFKVV